MAKATWHWNAERWCLAVARWQFTLGEWLVRCLPPAPWVPGCSMNRVITTLVSPLGLLTVQVAS